MKIVQLLKVSRAWNSLIVFASVFLGAVFAGTVSPSAPVILACISAALIAGGGYSLNDYFDYRTDLVNKPTRPIPRGGLTRVQALLLSVFLTGSGIITAHMVGRNSGFVAVCAAILLFFYSYILKRLALIGNLVVSCLCGLVFLYGGLSVGRVSPTLVPAAFSFLFHLGREILKDVEDVEGDRRTGAITVPIWLGVRTSILFSTLIYVGLIAATPIPSALGIYNLRYLVAVVVLVDLPLVLLLFYARRPNADYAFVNRVLKIVMPLGLLSLYLGR
jgi:geranylgeranylglycerol-phosphate geranylgeranyltransferase